MYDYQTRLLRSLVKVLDTIKEQIETITEYAKAQEKPKEPAPPGPPQRVSAEIYFPPEISNRYYAEHNKAHRIQRWTFWVGVLTLGALVAYTCVTYHEWQAMLESNRITRISAEAAQSAAATAKATLDTSEKSFKQEQRAYVSATTFNMTNPPICRFPPDNGTRVCVDVHTFNSGRTPAIGSRTTRHVTFGPRARKVIESLDVPPFAVPFSDMWGSGLEHWATGYTKIIDSKTAQSLIDGTTEVYIYGVIQYFDIFGDYHETGFCSHKLRSGAFMGCEFGNWFDRKPNKKINK